MMVSMAITIKYYRVDEASFMYACIVLGTFRWVIMNWELADALDSDNNNVMYRLYTEVQVSM